MHAKLKKNLQPIKSVQKQNFPRKFTGENVANGFRAKTPKGTARKLNENKILPLNLPIESIKAFSTSVLFLWVFLI